MLDTLHTFALQFGLTSSSLLVAGIGVGAILTIYGVSGALDGRNPAVRRMVAQRRSSRESGAARELLRLSSADPTGLLKALLPADQKERSLIQRQLEQAGIRSPNAVRNFYLLRFSLGVLLPLILVAVFYVIRSGLVAVPTPIESLIDGMPRTKVLFLLSGLIGFGFYGPIVWLRGRVAERRRQIEEAFPNALDLIQISVEAGLGFDAAIHRVASELTVAAPIISVELLLVYREIQAGRGREHALLAMANRVDIDQVVSFVNVVLQALRFGTSMSSALTAYAADMRMSRELKAQELANKLPVKMSGVMASLMLPALIILTVGPVVIRYIRFFSV